MTINVVPLKKTETPLRYDFTAVCLDDKDEFKKDIVYEFFYKEIVDPKYKVHYYFKEYGKDLLHEIDRGQYNSVENIINNDERKRTDFWVLGNGGFESCVVPKIKNILGVKFKVQRVFKPRIRNKKLVGQKNYEILNR
jgi:hypothetical protein